MNKLTPKDRIFIDEYLIDLDAERAAIQAGYSKTVARTKAYCWVSKSKHNGKPHIFEYVQQAMQERSRRTEITQDRVLEEFAKLAFLQPKHLFDDEGEILPIKEIPDDVAACISGLDISNRKIGDEDYETIKKIKLIDKKGALDSLAKHLGMFSEDSRKPDTPTTINITFSDA